MFTIVPIVLALQTAGHPNRSKKSLRLHEQRQPRARVGIAKILGFTLLELLVVIVIIGLLAGLVVPRYFDSVSKSKAKVARAQMAAFEKALEQYRLDVGSLPNQEQGLEALVTQPSNMPKWQGPYLKKAVPPDPWGHPYVYQLLPNQRDPEIISWGSDGKAGGSDEAKDIYFSATD